MAWRKIEAGAGGRQARKAVLQVVGRMNPGGVETWLLHVLRRMDPARFRMDFLVFEDGAYAGEVRRAGGRIVRCANPQRHPLGFLRDLSRILREEGPYDAVHCHMNHFSGLVLRAAHRAGVRARISQSHIDTSHVDGAAHGLRQGYLALSRMLIDRHATHLLAVSDEAGRSLYGPAFRDDPRFRRFACALDFDRFAGPIDRAALRRALGVPADSMVIGNVGRLAPQKNQAFLLEILAEAARKEPALRAVIVGDGPLRGPLLAKARGLGLEDRVVFMGPRTDVEKILPALDAFVFPSQFEGLPLATLEAQGCGLPCLLSDAIPAEAAIAPELVRRLPLEAGASFWADELLRTLRGPRPLTPAQALERLRQSPHDVSASVRELESLYLAG